MRYSILFLTGLGFIFFSCKKDNPKPLDKIVFIDLNPDIDINTISQYYTNMNPFCGQLPMPNDSIASINLDLNNDSENDLKIEVSHYQQEITQYCGHCEIFYIKTIRVSPLNTRIFVSIDTISKSWIRTYDTTKIVSNSDLWSNSSHTALLEDGCMIPNFSFEDTYWGFKLNDMIGWLHVERSSKNGLRIKEFAYNETKDNSIKVGQK
jgi:hypothetical protein